VPDNPTAFQGATTVTLDVGRVATSVSGQTSPATGSGLTEPVSGLPLPESAPPPIATADALPSAAGAVGATPSLDVASGAGVADGGSAAGSAFAEQANPSAPPEAPRPGPTEVAAGKPQRGSALRRAVGRTVDASDLYILFIVLGAVAVAAGSLLRKVGVRF